MVVAGETCNAFDERIVHNAGTLLHTDVVQFGRIAANNPELTMPDLTMMLLLACTALMSAGLGYAVARLPRARAETELKTEREMLATELASVREQYHARGEALTAAHSEQATLRERLLVLLRESRDPYFDVLIEHGVKPSGPSVNVAPKDYPIVGWPEGN